MKTSHIVIITVIAILAVLYLARKFMFKKVIGFIISKNEGGYVNDPNDKGGETNYGIAKRWHPNVDIKNLTLEQAENIYYDEYFSKLPTLTDINLLYQILDMAINAGVSKALELYKVGMSVEDYKNARIAYYKTLPQFTLYGAGWVNRVNRNIV
jgi:lysozyme family protein